MYEDLARVPPALQHSSSCGRFELESLPCKASDPLDEGRLMLSILQFHAASSLKDRSREVFGESCIPSNMSSGLIFTSR